MTESTISKFRWASRILTGLAGLAALLVVADVGPEVHRYAALAVAALGYAATWFAKHTPPPEKTAKRPPMGPAAVFTVLAFLAIAPACVTPYKAAWGTLGGMLQARDATAEAIATHTRPLHVAALGAHGPKTAGYATAMKVPAERVKAWRTIGRPTITSSVRLAGVGLDAAKATGADGFDWRKVAQPAACELQRVAQDRRERLPALLATVLAVVAPFDSVLCADLNSGAYLAQLRSGLAAGPEEHRASAAGVGAGLAALAQLIAWIAEAVGEPVSKIRSRVRDALAKPMTDATDVLAREIAAAMPEPQ